MSYKKHTESYLYGIILTIMSELEFDVINTLKESTDRKIERLEKRIEDLHMYIGNLNERLNYLNEKITTD
ncbi:MAG: hypothetical protein KGZ37_03915 [Nitrosarchaeum sp.]|nr:hypothetical protein [Nitrosarchaeum sp.]